MSPPPPSVTDIIGNARRIVRRDAGVAIVAALLTLAPAVLIVAWLLAGWPGWTSPSAAPLVVDVLVLLIAGGFLALAARALQRRTSEREIAGAAESRAGLPRGTVAGVLELARGVPRGTSVALFQRTERTLSARLAGTKSADVSGGAGRVARRQLRRALAGLVVASGVAVGLALVSPERSRAGWPALLQPLAHLSGPLLPALEVEPGDVQVPRGMDVEVRVRAAGRFAITVHHRADGDVPRNQTVAVVGEFASVRFPVDARTVYWVAAPDGASSPQYVATPLDPLLVSELVVEVRYPPHAGRLPERYETDVPPIEVPEGTTLAVSGRATLRLDDAALVADGSIVPLTVDGERFAATWTPTASALWAWRLESRLAGAPGTLPPPLDVTVVPDGPPTVAMTFPARDTILDATRIQPLAADAEDDFGISAAALVWRIVRNGRAETPVETPIPFDSTGSRVFIRGVLDAREFDLLPGDTIRYFVRVADNGPRAQTAASAEWALYLPDRPEMRDRAEDRLAQAVEETRNLSQSARALQDATRDLQRRTQAAQARTGSSASATTRQGQGQQGSLGFRETEQARQVLEQQQELAARLEEMRQRLEAMENEIANAALRDPKLEEQLKELRELYDQMLNPELQQQMQQLQDALDTLDPEELERALEELAARQQQIREQLQQSLDQLRRAATQEQINALAQEARELATQQAALAEALQKGQAGADATEQQQQLQARAGDLQQSVSELNGELQRQQEQQAATSSQSANDAIERARQQMQNAADRAGTPDQDAAAEGRQAAVNLERAAQNLDAARDAMANGAERRMTEVMQQAMRDAEQLARKQDELRQQMEQARQQPEPGQRGQQQGQQQQGQRGQQQGQQQQGQRGQQQGQQGQQAGGAGDAMQQLRDQQSALQQEMNRLSQSLAQQADQTGQVSREVGTEMGRADASMQRTTQAMQQAGDQQGMPTREAGQTVESLERLAQALQRNVQMLQQGDPSSASEQVRQQLGDIAQQQGQLNGRTNALLPLRLNPQSLAQQAGRMAQDQRQIAQRIEQLDEKGVSKDDVLGRLDEMAQEAERLAQALEGGRPPAEVLSRQERLFHRLLDAGRSLEKEELSEKRVGEAPGVWTPSLPKALDPTLLQAGDRYRLPTAEELRALPPAYRKMVLEYFGRINRSSGTGGSDGG